MSAIPFTDSELKRAWRELSTVATRPAPNDPQNPRRLLLFYAVECGLKAVWLKRHSRTLFEGTDIHQVGHDLQQLLKDLKVGSKMSLPTSVQLPTARKGTTAFPRKTKFGDVHQAWRYGGRCQTPTDQDCEQQLMKVLNWIQGELR